MAIYFQPPRVRCDTRIWHPNINEDGEVCLSLLRQNSLDALGWAPTRKLKDVTWGLNSLFGDLLNFDDPLNVDAAEHYGKDKVCLLSLLWFPLRLKNWQRIFHSWYKVWEFYTKCRISSKHSTAYR